MESGANIIFIEKRKSFSASLGNACAFPDLSVGLTMLFSLRWIFAPLTDYDNSLSELLCFLGEFTVLFSR